MRKLDRDPQTLGKKLRALRRGQAVSMDMMVQATHVQRKYLVALEKGDYPVLPEPLYTRNFIRSYARVLHADEDYFLELYEEECGLCDLVEPSRTPRQRMRRVKLLVWNRFVKIGLVGLVACAILFYLGSQIRSITAPPDVLLFSPADEMISSQAIILVEGLVDGEATVYVNGEQVVVSEDSSFATDIDLESGLNVITVEAERRYSRRAVLERRVVFEPEDHFTVNN